LLVIILTVILASHMDGVPDDVVFKHARVNRRVYVGPQPVAYAGLFLLAIGYGIDLNPRIGCPAFMFLIVAAPCFPLFTFAALKYAQGRRKRSEEIFSANETPLRVALFDSWGDLLVEEKGQETTRTQEM